VFESHFDTLDAASDADGLYLPGRNFPPRYAEKAIKTDFSQEDLSLLNQPQEYVKGDNIVSRTQCLFYYKGCSKTIEYPFYHAFFN